MDLQHKPLARDLERVEPVSLGAPNDSDPGSRADSTNVTVSYGIHHGRYPIGGMTVRDARRTLQKLINIDPSALAVINGVPVDEDEQILSHVTMLSFVKRSSLKG